MIDLALEPGGVFGRDAEAGLGDVAGDERHPPVGRAPERVQRGGEFGARLADQHGDRLVAALEKPPDEPLADESGSASDERAHELPLPSL